MPPKRTKRTEQRSSRRSSSSKDSRKTTRGTGTSKGRRKATPRTEAETSTTASTSASGESVTAQSSTAAPKKKNKRKDHPSSDSSSVQIPQKAARYTSPITVTDEEPDPSIRGHNDRPTCFRISGIPSDWSTDKLGEELQKIDPELDLTDAELSAPCPACCDSTKTALINFNRGTAYFRGFGRNEERQKVIHENGRKARLVIDKHFYDLTPLNRPNTPVVADVIAVTGLGGHAFGSWRSRAATDRSVDRPMWLRDFLAPEFPDLRIMTYGYDSSLKNPNAANLTDYRRNFGECLQNARRDCPKRPIIFIGHSLGGILIVQTLVESSSYFGTQGIRDCIRGIFFFGTPHQGLRTVELEEMLDGADGESDTGLKVRNLLAQLREGSEFLENQKEALSRMWENFHGKVFTFYETEKTKAVKKLGPGIVEREGKEVQMVQRVSAQLYLPKESRFPIHSNHTDMVKFASSQDRAFQTIVTCMKECVEPSNRERLMPSIIRSLTVSDVYFIDQKKYLDNRFESGELEQDGKFFWIFRNLDYKSWSNIAENVRVLVLSGSSSLEHAASHIVSTLQNGGCEELVLHFFYRSTRNEIRPLNLPLAVEWNDLLCVCTLLKQVIDRHHPLQQESLLRLFLEEILAPMDEKVLVRIDAEREFTKAFMRFLSHSNLENLLLALWQVLSKAAELNEDNNASERARAGAIQNTRPLTFALDLEEQKASSALIDFFRQNMESLNRAYPTVRLLVTNPRPSDLGLKPPSEVLIEYDKERKDCLKTLRFQNTRFEKISDHCENTFEWLWESAEYRAWNSTERSSVLIIEGKPGSGKSTLVRYFANNLHTAQDGAIVAKFFYSYRDGELERDHGNLLRSLLYDILKADESFFIHFQEEYRALGGRPDHDGPRGTWSYETLKSILRCCVMNHPRKRRLFLIVDAMDESDKVDREDIIQLFTSFSALDDMGSFVKVFLASRPMNEIKDLPTVERIRLQEKNRNDIQTYTRKFLQKPLFHSIHGISNRIEDYIVNKAGGVFLWVHLIAVRLESFLKKGSTAAKVLKELKSLPTELESYYKHILGELLEGDQDDLSYGKRILQFCLYSHRPIRLLELKDALAISGESSDPPPYASSWEFERSTDIKRLVTHCAGCFVEIKNKITPFLDETNPEESAIVQVMHQTVRDFFHRPHDSVNGSPYEILKDNQEALVMIGTTCTRYLKIHHDELMCDFQSPSKYWSSEDFRKFVQYLNTRPFINYALEYLKTQVAHLDHAIPQLLADLIAIVRNCPQSPAFCLLKRLVDSDRDLSNVQEQADFLLGVAADDGRTVAVRNLLAAGANSCSIDKRHNTPLHRAASNGHVATVQLLLDRGAAIEANGLYDQTALHHAAENGYEATVRLLLDRGAEIEAKGFYHQTALHLAAENGHEATVRLLFDRGAESEAMLFTLDGRTLTALHLAAKNGHEATVRLLLDRGAEIEAKGSGDQTALHLAAENGHEATVTLLRYRGARPRNTFCHRA